jgi:hypothetical protein
MENLQLTQPGSYTLQEGPCSADVTPSPSSPFATLRVLRARDLTRDHAWAPRLRSLGMRFNF